MVRTFKKPTLTKEVPLEENILERVLPLPDIMSNREKYLARLNAQIYEKEREWESISSSFEVKKNATDATFNEYTESLKRQIRELESVLALKRSERVELEKPYIGRSKELDERQSKLDERSKSLDEYAQATFEKERAAEGKLEGIQDLADTLGETRVRLTVKENLLNGREMLIKDKEMRLLVQDSKQQERANKIAAQLQERDNAVTLKELNVQGKEENLERREKELLDGFILLNDQRGTLGRGFNELRRKQQQHG
jgi:epidermal growth factor receptor substrate 15